MLSKVANVSTESIERISSSVGNMARERRLSSSSSRMDKLLGLSPSSQSVLSDASDLNDLNEDDIWEEELRMIGGWKEDSFNIKLRDKEPRDMPRTFSDHKRWPGVERDSGLSFSIGEGGRSRGLSSLSPMNRGSGTVGGHGLSREGTPSRLSSASRMIPQVGTNSDYNRRVVTQSAPVEVPDWSKIMGMDQKVRDKETFDQDEDDDAERLPPHVQLAREYARAPITSFSVFEGAGRTLKGRDLSRVRNAVWRQTGFLG